jgi:predicted phage-related endonuclease
MTIIPIPTDRDEWLKLRLDYIGGSETAALFHAQPGYGYSLFAMHHTKAKRIPERAIDSERMEAGTFMEPAIARWAAHREGWGLEQGGYAIDDTTPGLGASLDYQIRSHAETDPAFEGPGVLEIKNVSWQAWKNTWGKRPPLFIELQAQHQIAASGFKWCAIACCVDGNSLHVWKRAARPRIIDELRKRIGTFWENVRNGTPPDVEGSDATADALKALYDVESDRKIEVPDDLAEQMHAMCAALSQEREASKASETRQQAAKNFIKAVMQGAGSAYVPPPDADSPAFYARQDARGAIKISEVSPT